MSNTMTPRRISVQLLELDMSLSGDSGCSTCSSAENQIRELVANIQPFFDRVHLEICIEKIMVQSLEQAERLKFRASPTIRIHGKEIVPEQGDLFGFGPRYWSWEGKEYVSPPESLIVDALLRAYPKNDAEPLPNHSYQLPERLKEFFSIPQEADTEQNSCCS